MHLHVLFYKQMRKIELDEEYVSLSFDVLRIVRNITSNMLINRRGEEGEILTDEKEIIDELKRYLNLTLEGRNQQKKMRKILREIIRE